MSSSPIEKRAAGAIASLETEDQEKLRLLDLWQFQRREIEVAELQPAEDTELEAERRIQRKTPAACWRLPGRHMTRSMNRPNPCRPWRVSRWQKSWMNWAGSTLRCSPCARPSEPALLAVERGFVSASRLSGAPRSQPGTAGVKSKTGFRGHRQAQPEIRWICRANSGVPRRCVAQDRGRGDRGRTARRVAARKSKALESEYQKEAASELTLRRKAAAKKLSERVEKELKPLAMEAHGLPD